MNNFLNKVPKPVLVFVVLAIAIALFVYKDPLKDECDVQAKIFERNTKGILTGVRKNGKIQFPLLMAMKERCREGSSVGSCTDYFEALRKIAGELKVFNDKCQLKYSEENENFTVYVSQGLQIMSLVAWGEKPPAGTAKRAGWLSEAQIKTFCTLKKAYVRLAGEENFTAIKNQIYREYPDAWPEPPAGENSAEVENRNPENRPHALKTVINPKGHFTKDEIYARSLFSMRCDLYL